MYAAPYPPQPPMAPPARRDPEAGRRVVGIVLYVLAMLGGAILLLLLFLVPALLSEDPGGELGEMAIGALLALPALLVYLWVPWIVDRYDPEPWWALLLVLFWGGIAACGFAALINTSVEGIAAGLFDKDVGEAVGACVSAPIVEEFMKGLAVFGVFYFLRREFDGVVDGVIYATFAALGFAAIENIIYYSGAAHEGGDALVGTVVMRGILGPWGHPLYTSMTGIGFGISRETNKTWLKWLAPMGGYCFAVFLHSTWNSAATFSGELMLLMLPLWFLFVFAFFGLVVWLVSRKGKIIREHLKDEVLMGNLTPWELELVTSPVGRIRATFSYGGAPGRAFIDAAARLALSKWHTGRATVGRAMTVSADLILPLRQDLRRLRGEVSRSMGRPVQEPQPWSPQQGQQQAWAQQQQQQRYR